MILVLVPLLLAQLFLLVSPCCPSSPLDLELDLPCTVAGLLLLLLTLAPDQIPASSCDLLLLVWLPCSSGYSCCSSVLVVLMV